MLFLPGAMHMHAHALSCKFGDFCNIFFWEQPLNGVVALWSIAHKGCFPTASLCYNAPVFGLLAENECYVGVTLTPPGWGYVQAGRGIFDLPQNSGDLPADSMPFPSQAEDRAVLWHSVGNEFEFHPAQCTEGKLTRGEEWSRFKGEVPRPCGQSSIKGGSTGWNGGAPPPHHLSTPPPTPPGLGGGSDTPLPGGGSGPTWGG